MKKLKKSIRTNHGEMNPKKISVCQIVATTRCTIILARFEISLLYPTTYYSAKKNRKQLMFLIINANYNVPYYYYMSIVRSVM